MVRVTVNDILGFFSGLLATFAFVPQVFLVWGQKPKPANDISLLMYIILCVGVAGWFVYGTRIKSRPVIFWNLVTFLFSLSILIYKIIYG